MRDRWRALSTMVNILVLSNAQLHRLCLAITGNWKRSYRDADLIWVLCVCLLQRGKHSSSWLWVPNGEKAMFTLNECETEQQSERQKQRATGKEKKKRREKEREREREQVGLVLRWLVWWVGDRESWSITYRSPIASVRGVVGKRGRVRERIGRESVLAWLLKILYSADDK